MRLHPRAVAPIVLVLTLAACSSASAEDETACKLFADANNRVTEALNARESEGDSARERFRQEAADLPRRVNEAAQRATGDLAVILRDAADYAPYHTDGDDAAMMYHFYERDVYEACAGLGVDLEIVDML